MAADNNVVTVRKIRAYTGTRGGKLVPIGGFMAGKLLNVDDTELRFQNAEHPVVMVNVPGMKHVYVLKSPVNMKPAPNEVFMADGGRDEHQPAFLIKEFKIPNFVLDYKTEVEFLNAEGKWDDELGFPGNGADSLLDDIYYNDGAGGYLTAAQIAALSPKQRKKYKKALKLDKKQTGISATAADTDQTKAFSDALKTPAPGASGAPASKEKASGPSPVLIGGVAFGILTIVVIAVFALKGKSGGTGTGGGGNAAAAA